MDMKTKLLINAGLVVSVCGLLVFAGCSHDPNRSAGRVLDDHKVAGKVKGALDDSPVYKFPHVKVTTYNGVVQLSGFVQSEEQKREAAQVARHTSGVTDVINNISIIPAEGIGAARDNRTGVSGRGTNAPSSTTDSDIRK